MVKESKTRNYRINLSTGKKKCELEKSQAMFTNGEGYRTTEQCPQLMAYVPLCYDTPCCSAAIITAHPHSSPRLLPTFTAAVCNPVDTQEALRKAH